MKLKFNIRLLVAALLLMGVLVAGCGIISKSGPAWTDEELKTIRSLWLNSLPPLPADPSNRYANDSRAAALGKQLFFDKRLSLNGQVSCATCHQPKHYFTDNLPLSQGISVVKRNAPSLIGVSYSPWFYWDGRRDSQWSQALVPLETPEEHGIDRHRVLQVVASDDDYLRLYRDVFNSEPDPDILQPNEIDHAFANIGKSIAAFERRLRPTASRFDAYLDDLFDGKPQLDPLNQQELSGLKLFIGEQAQCTRCHNGPLFSNFGFHNIGLVELKRGVSKYDFGRKQGVPKALQDPFNCLGAYSDAEAEECIELTYVKTTGREMIGAFKVPGLRNVDKTPPYMHDGRFETLNEVIAHYREAPTGRAGHQELNPIVLDTPQVEQLVAFLKTLTGELPSEAQAYD